MKSSFSFVIFLLFFSTIYSQQQNVNITFFHGQWNGLFSDHPVTIEFLDDSTSIWKTDYNGYFPEGLLLKYNLDLSAYPYKIKFHNPDSSNIPLQYLQASIEVIDENDIRFNGEKVIYSNGDEEEPAGDEGIILLSRKLNLE